MTLELKDIVRNEELNNEKYKQQKYISRNNDTDGWTIDDLSTISPDNRAKNFDINEGEISIKFTDDKRKEIESPAITPTNFNYEIKKPESDKIGWFSNHQKTKSQKIKSIGDFDKIARKSSNIHENPSFEDDIDPLTFNDYIKNAKMANEQKHKFSNPPSRSHSRKNTGNIGQSKFLIKVSA